MSQPNKCHWYQLAHADVLEQLGSSPQGLPTAISRRRLQQHGPNELKIHKPSRWQRLLRQLHNPLVYILLIATLLTAILGMWIDMAVILGVIVLNVAIGFCQESKAETALEALKRTLSQTCTIIRHGEATIIPARELVPGEIVSLSSGDRVPADLRLICTHDAHFDESALTGESVPVLKQTEAIESAHLPPGDQRCMAFSSTFMSRGSALGVVVATGERSEIGQIAVLMKQTKAPLTPLQKQIASFTRSLLIAVLLIGALNFGIGLLIDYRLGYNFLGSIALIVAAIPEMLPMIVTGILALAATHMARCNALIRQLPAAETLGCTTVICSDKTGTLTKNEMTVQAVLCADALYQVHGTGYDPEGFLLHNGRLLDRAALPAPLRATLLAGLSCNNAQLVKEGAHHHIVGDPTEGALLVAASKAQISDHSERLDEIPFDSDKMYMATLQRGEGRNHIFVKGSPEQVLALCTHQQTAQGTAALQAERLHQGAGNLAGQALRLLAMAHKAVPSHHTRITSKDLHTLTFLGIQGMIDPPRQEAIDAIRKCKHAGIRTLMITGDHSLTAAAVARQIGIIDQRAHSTLGGQQLACMSDAKLRAALETVSVFARVAPEQKLRIARQLQQRGEIVAMTGDGVNDAPALKAADIGIAMGITGTEVSKAAASIVLTDDNFASIVDAVEEGRHAWNNLEKAILYTVPTNGGQALLVIGAVLMASFVPIFSARLTLEPVMILWINLFDSVCLTMPLMMERKEAQLLESPPRPRNQKLASSLLLQRVLLMGLTIALPGFWIYHHFGAAAVAADGTILDPHLLTQAQTAAFWAVLMVHDGFVMSARSVYKSAFTFSPFSNKWLLLGISASLALRLLPMLFPQIASIFRMASFPAEWWLYILPCLLPGFIVLELDKLLRRRLGSA